MHEIAPGIIMIWSGTEITIPTGWVKCDGNNGTPDLRDRFVVATGPLILQGTTGGSLTHTHDFTSDGHSHQMQAGPNFGPGAAFDFNTTNDNDTGITDASPNVPPFYSLIHIMKT